MNTFLTKAVSLDLPSCPFQILVKLAAAADPDGVLPLGTMKMTDLFQQILNVSCVTGYKWINELEEQGFLSIVRTDEGRRRYGVPTHIELTF